MYIHTEKKCTVVSRCKCTEEIRIVAHTDTLSAHVEQSTRAFWPNVFSSRATDRSRPAKLTYLWRSSSRRSVFVFACVCNFAYTRGVLRFTAYKRERTRVGDKRNHSEARACQFADLARKSVSSLA